MVETYNQKDIGESAAKGINSMSFMDLGYICDIGVFVYIHPNKSEKANKNVQWLKNLFIDSVYSNLDVFAS